MSKIGLIIGREYSSRVKKKSFIVMTILVPILSAVFLVGAVYLGVPKSGAITTWHFSLSLSLSKPDLGVHHTFTSPDDISTNEKLS